MPTFRKDIKTGTKVPLIKTDDLNDKLITTDKLADGSVTNSKLAPESVTQDKFDKQLLEVFQAAAGLPKDLIETIQNVDDTLKDHQKQISSNDDDISDLQSQTKQIKDTVDGIAISGGASIASAVSYDNTTSGLEAMNLQNAIDEILREKDKKFSYSYYYPSEAPTVELVDNNYILDFSCLTILRLEYLSIVVSSYKQKINFGLLNSTYLVYYDIADKRIYFTDIYNKKVEGFEDSKEIKDKYNIVILGIFNNNKYSDYLILNSLYLQDNSDTSVLGKVEKLYPTSVEPILFNKYKYGISGHNLTSNNLDFRISEEVYTKHKYVFIKGSFKSENNEKIDTNLEFRIANSKFVNMFACNIEVDDNGTFSLFKIIPTNIWALLEQDGIYNAFVFCYNRNNLNLSLSIEEAYFADYPGIGSNTILDNDGIEDTIKYADGISNFIKAQNDSKIYGKYEPELALYAFPVVPHLTYYATTKNSEVNQDGFITKVIAQVNNAGNYTFKVGLLDQYSRFVVSEEFTLSLGNGINEIDVREKMIPISKGEQIAIKCVSNEGTTGNSSICYAENKKAIDNEIIYGPENGVWAALGSTYGGVIKLAYEIITLDTIFASKTDIDKISKQIDKQNDAINSLKYIYDNTGNPYKLTIVNGNVVAKSIQYKKVLALGNSLTSHGYAENIGYYGDDKWAMASTNKETTTWTYHLQNILRQKQPDATVTPFNIFAWETNYMNADLDSLFSEHKSIDYDLIVFRAGENGTAGDDYAQGVDRLVSFLTNTFPTATIVITDMFWHTSTKEKAFMQIAYKYNLQYVTFGNIADRCLLGQMLMGKDGTLHPIIHNGVSGHCTDVCFFDFANILASALGYEEQEGKHNVVISSNIDYDINNVSQIKDGYVSILTYESSKPNIVAKNGVESLDVSIHSMSEVTWINAPSKIPTYVCSFKMPDSDVNVSLTK